VLESYNEGDVVSGKVTKVVTFGAFVEILPGVEGLVHISELAQHHVENPREVVSQGDTVNVRILEVDAERRRLSLSLKRVDDGMPLQPPIGEDAAPPTIDLSEDVFSDEANAAPGEADEPEAVEQPVAVEQPEAVGQPEAIEEPEAVEEPEAAEEVVAMTDHTRPPAPEPGTPVEVPPDKAPAPKPNPIESSDEPEPTD
jgi:small subunit ribosomal protein S1